MLIKYNIYFDRESRILYEWLFLYDYGRYNDSAFVFCSTQSINSA